MELYFLRHGDAEDPRPDLPDAQRALTEEGVRTTESEALGLRKLGLAPGVILTSPLLRARQTAEIVARALGAGEPIAEDELASGCDIDRLARALSRHPGHEQVIVVGHEPDFSTMIGELVGGAKVELKKGGLALVSLSEVAPGAGVLRWLLTAEHLCAMA